MEDVVEIVDHIVWGVRDDWQQQPKYAYCQGCGVEVDHTKLAVLIQAALEKERAEGDRLRAALREMAEQIDVTSYAYSVAQDALKVAE